MSDCLTTADFDDLAAQKVADDRRQQLCHHIRDCDRCQTALVQDRDRRVLEQARRALQHSDRPLGLRTAAPISTNNGNAAPPQRHTIPNIPGHELLRRVDHGGQGIVYEGIQTSTKRRVAIKVLHDFALATPREQQRFMLEAELMATLHHPAIVPVHECGMVHGSPYFTMTMIDGLDLRDYLADHSLSTQDVLELFCQICDGIAFAHNHGIIHRDIKPSNVLVDARQRVHLVDFGLARRCHDASQSMSIARQFAGTLTYAAPETLTGSSNATNAISDVYSLGILLYEMVTGQLPYRTVKSLTEAVELVSQTPATPPRQHKPTLARDLEVIVLKAIHQDPAARYQTVRALQSDVGQFMNYKPIAARPPSLTYRTRMFAKRHQRTIALTGGTSLSALLIIGVMWWSNRTVQDQQVRALHAQEEIIKQHALSREALSAIHELILTADPTASGLHYSRPEFLQYLTEQVSFERDPAVRDEMRAWLGNACRRVGDYERAESLLIDAVDDPQATVDPSTKALRLLAIGALGLERGQFDRARSYYEQVIQLCDDEELVHERATALIGLSTIAMARGQFDLSLAQLVRALKIREHLHSQSHHSVRFIHCRLGIVLLKMGDLDRAHEELTSALRYAQDDRRRFESAFIHGHLAELYLNRDELDTARQHIAMAKRDIIGQLSSANSFSAYLATIEGRINYGDGQPELALGNLESALQIYDDITKDHPQAHSIRSHLASVLLQLGRSQDALAALQQAEHGLRIIGHAAALSLTLERKAYALLRLNRRHDALRAAQEAVDLSCTLSHKPLIQARVRVLCARINRDLHNTEEAVAYYEQACQVANDPVMIFETRRELALLLCNHAKLSSAQQELRVALDAIRTDHRQQHRAALALYELGNLSIRTQSYEQASRLHQEALALRRDYYGNEHRDVLRSLDQLASAYHLQSRHQDAIAYFKEAFDVAKALLGEDHPDVRKRLGMIRQYEKRTGT